MLKALGFISSSAKEKKNVRRFTRGSHQEKAWRKSKQQVGYHLRTPNTIWVFMHGFLSPFKLHLKPKAFDFEGL
jgi:hypothetical protein